MNEKNKQNQKDTVQGPVWYAKTADEVIESLSSTPTGLSTDEAKKRTQQYGINKIPDAKPEGIFIIFLKQFKSPLIYTLLAAASVLAILTEWMDGGIILLVLLFNAAVATFQAGRAQNTLLALRKFVKTNATVIRDGKEVIIPDSELTPGDIIILQEGEKIPADCRLIESRGLRVDESALTGESEPVNKNVEPILKENITASDQKNMVFRGTHIVAGNARAIVVTTGLATEVGKISLKISSIDTEIPLQKDMRFLARIIIGVVLAISTMIFTIGILTGRPMEEMFKLAVAVVVSAVPEGLPIVMTLLLAMGVWRMSKRNVLVKKLQAVEALGETKVIAVDKTGTVTENQMIVQIVFADGETFSVSGNGYEIEGNISLEGSTDKIEANNYPALFQSANIATFCSNARINPQTINDSSSETQVAGDPTEAAMMVFAEKLGIKKQNLIQNTPELSELPFDPKLKYHAVLTKQKDGTLLMAAGAPEELLKISSTILSAGKEIALTDEKRQELENLFLDMARQGLRVIATVSKKSTSQTLSEKDITNLTFVGFLGMKDGLRKGVHDAVAATKAAGARVVMITGDHKVTAEAVAREAGIMIDGDNILEGNQIESMTDEELAKSLDGVSVFARVTPQHKLRLVEAYRRRGEVIAMTGDGVNDALSLVAADIGVGMGKIGTEVAKEASDIILLDDNFGSIVAAIEEGRSIYKGLKKVLLFLFSTNIGEILIILGALALGYPLPVLAVQLIWLNFVTDGFIVAALSMDPKEKGLLTQKFKKPGKFIFDGHMVRRMSIMSITMAVGTLFLFHHYFENYDLVKAMTVALTLMAVYQWFKAWNCRSDFRSVFTTNPLENKYLFFVMFVVVGLQLAALNVGFMQSILKTVPLSLHDWILIVTVASSTFVVDELQKMFYRARLKKIEKNA